MRLDSSSLEYSNVRRKEPLAPEGQGQVSKSTLASRRTSTLSELLIRQTASAFSSNRIAADSEASAANRSVTALTISVNRVVRSDRSSIPWVTHCIETQSNFEACDTARKDKTKQSATDASNSVSGDQRSPGPSNSIGGALAIGTTPAVDSVTEPAPWSSAFTV
jgi:hypothetical protein